MTIRGRAAPIMRALAELRKRDPRPRYEPALSGDPQAASKLFHLSPEERFARIATAFPGKHPLLAPALAREGGRHFIDAIAGQHEYLAWYAPHRDPVERWLSGLDLRQLHEAERAVIRGHPREWELLQNPAIARGRGSKAERVARILGLLSGSHLQGAPAPRRDLADAELRVRGWERTDFFRSITVLDALIDHAEAERGHLSTLVAADDRQLSMRAAMLAQRVERLLDKVSGLDREIEDTAAIVRRAIARRDVALDAVLAVVDPGDRDGVLHRLLGIHRVPARETPSTREMHGYQASSLLQIEQFLDRAGVDRSSVVYDIGCGLGKVPIVAALRKGCRAIGIEYDAALARRASSTVDALGVAGRVEIRNGDARTACYDDGTVFYFFNPFGPNILDDVYRKLEAIARRRPITIVTLGPMLAPPFADCVVPSPSVYEPRVFRTRLHEGARAADSR